MLRPGAWHRHQTMPAHHHWYWTIAALPSSTSLLDGSEYWTPERAGNYPRQHSMVVVKPTVEPGLKWHQATWPSEKLKAMDSGTKVWTLEQSRPELKFSLWNFHPFNKYSVTIQYKRGTHASAGDTGGSDLHNSSPCTVWRARQWVNNQWITKFIINFGRVRRDIQRVRPWDAGQWGRGPPWGPSGRGSWWGHLNWDLDTRKDQPCRGWWRAPRQRARGHEKWAEKQRDTRREGRAHQQGLWGHPRSSASPTKRWEVTGGLSRPVMRSGIVVPATTLAATVCQSLQGSVTLGRSLKLTESQSSHL